MKKVLIRGKISKGVFFLIALLLLGLLSGCSNNPETGEVVDTTIDTLEELNQALNSGVTLIELAASISGDALITNRGKDLILDLNGHTLNGNLEVDQPGNTNDWSLTITSTAVGGTITGDLVINDPALTISNEGNVTGTTSIINAAAETFNNDGILNDVVITDVDGLNFLNETNGSINGSLVVNSINPLQPIFLSGDFGQTTITIDGPGSIVYLAENAQISNLEITASNCTIVLLSGSKCGNIHSTGNNNHIEAVDSAEYTVSGSGYQEWNLNLEPFELVPVPGIYDEPQNISFSDSSLDYYYTTDGSEPTRNSTLAINGELVVDNTMTLKVKGYSADSHVTPVVTGHYTISNDQQPPVITVAGVENNGVYVGPVIPVISANEEVTYDIKLLKDGSEIPFTSGQTLSDTGDYQLTITATDLANNSSTETITFTITTASISGQINILASGVNPRGITVLIIDNSNFENIKSYDELSIIASTITNFSGEFSGEFSFNKNFNNIPAGKYYLIAYADMNGDDVLEFMEVEDGGITKYIPLEPFGIYCDEMGNPVQLVVDSPEIQDIDFDLEMKTHRYNLSVNVLAPFAGSKGETVAGADVYLYPREIDSAYQHGETDNKGNEVFNDIYGGYYYLKVTAAGYRDTLSPLYPLMYPEIVDIDSVPTELNTAVFTNESLKGLYGLINPTDSLDNGAYFLLAIEEEALSGDSLFISPSSGEIGYLPSPSSSSLDFNLTSFPDIGKGAYIAGIRNIPPGTYQIGLESNPDETLEITVENGDFVFYEPLKFDIDG